jgi:hypothetical protein
MYFWVTLWIALVLAWIYTGWKFGRSRPKSAQLRNHCLYIIALNVCVIDSALGPLGNESYLLQFFPSIIWLSPIGGSLAFLLGKISLRVTNKTPWKRH